MRIDDDGPCVAAAYLVDDQEFKGTQHGSHEGTTLCGIGAPRFVIVRNAFHGTHPRDCQECARELRSLAAEQADSGRA